MLRKKKTGLPRTLPRPWERLGRPVPQARPWTEHRRQQGWSKAALGDTWDRPHRRGAREAGRPGVSVQQFHFPLGQSEKLLFLGLGLQVLSILVVGELPYRQWRAQRPAEGVSLWPCPPSESLSPRGAERCSWRQVWESPDTARPEIFLSEGSYLQWSHRDLSPSAQEEFLIRRDVTIQKPTVNSPLWWQRTGSAEVHSPWVLLQYALQGGESTGRSVCESTLNLWKCWGIFPKRNQGAYKKTILKLKTFWHQMCGFYNQAIFQFSEMPARCPTIPFNSDAIYLGLTQPSQVKGFLQPGRRQQASRAHSVGHS